MRVAASILIISLVLTQPAAAAVLVEAAGTSRLNSASYSPERDRQQGLVVQRGNEPVPNDINLDVRTPGTSDQPRSYHIELDGDHFVLRGSYANGESYAYEIDLSDPNKLLVYLRPGDAENDIVSYDSSSEGWRSHVTAILGILSDALKRNRDPQKEAQIRHALGAISTLLQNAVTVPPLHSGGSGSFSGYYAPQTGFRGVNWTPAYNLYVSEIEEFGISASVYYGIDWETLTISVGHRINPQEPYEFEYVSKQEDPVRWESTLREYIQLMQKARSRYYLTLVLEAFDRQIAQLEALLMIPPIPYGQAIYNVFGEYAYSATIHPDGTAELFDGYATYEAVYFSEAQELVAYTAEPGNAANSIHIFLFFDPVSGIYQIKRYAQYSQSGEGDELSQGFRIVDYDFTRHVMTERTLLFYLNPNSDILATTTEWTYASFNNQWRPVERRHTYVGPAQWYYGAEPKSESIRENTYYVRGADGEIERTVVTQYSSATGQTQTSLYLPMDGYGRTYYIYDDGNTTSQYTQDLDESYAEAHADQRIEQYLLGQGYDGFYTARVHYRRQGETNEFKPYFVWTIVNGLPRSTVYIVGEWDRFSGESDDIAVPSRQDVLGGAYELNIGGNFYGYYYSQLRIQDPYLLFISNDGQEWVSLEGFPENDIVTLAGQMYRVRLEDGQFVLEVV